MLSLFGRFLVTFLPIPFCLPLLLRQGDLRPLSANLHTIIYNCARLWLFGPQVYEELSSQNDNTYRQSFTIVHKYLNQNSPDRGQSRKIRFSKCPGSGQTMSELCVLLFFPAKNQQNVPKVPV